MRPGVTVLPGGDLAYHWPDFSIQVELTALHQTDAGGVRGMIEVTNGRGGPIYWNTFSVTGGTDRKTLVGKLQKAARRDEGDWELDVDRMCQDAYKRHITVPDPLRLADMHDEPLDVSFLYDPLLPEGLITLFLADQGSTKSFFMLYLAACTALGIPSVFGPPRRKGPVVFFDWEVNEHVARRRLALICRGLGAELPRDLYYVNMCERGRLLDVVRDMRYQIEKLGAVLAIVDSLTFATGADLNSTEYSAPTMSAIGSLGAGVTKLVSSHPNKSQRNNKAADISVIGSVLFEFRARMIWTLRRIGERQASRFDVKLETRKPFDGRPAAELAYRLAFDNVKYTARFEALGITGGGAAEEDGTQTGQIRAALRKFQRADSKQLAEWTGIAEDDVRKLCGAASDIFAVIAGGGRGRATVWALGNPNTGDVVVPWWSNDKPTS